MQTCGETQTNQSCYNANSTRQDNELDVMGVDNWAYGFLGVSGNLPNLGVMVHYHLPAHSPT